MTEETPVPPIPPNLQAALVLLLTIGLTSLATKMGFDAKDIAAAVGTVAVALAGLLCGGYVWLITHMQTKKVDTAESLVPGITTPAGPISPKTTITNDPNSPEKPIVTSAPPSAPPNPEPKP